MTNVDLQKGTDIVIRRIYTLVVFSGRFPNPNQQMDIFGKRVTPCGALPRDLN